MPDIKGENSTTGKKALRKSNMSWKFGDPIPTRQEMFDMAVRGLRAQGWQRSVDNNGTCQYQDQDGRRCAWGQVDSTLTGLDEGIVILLRQRGVGLAGHLTVEDAKFARDLQMAHDFDTARGMEDEFRNLADMYNLTWPEEK